MNVLKLYYKDYRKLVSIISLAMKATNYTGFVKGEMTHEEYRLIYIFSYEDNKLFESELKNLFKSFKVTVL